MRNVRSRRNRFDKWLMKHGFDAYWGFLVLLFAITTMLAGVHLLA